MFMATSLEGKVLVVLEVLVLLVQEVLGIFDVRDSGGEARGEPSQNPLNH
jgi:hypothetical protein